MAEDKDNRNTDSDPKTNHGWHLRHVFNDDAFNIQLEAIRQMEKEAPADESIAVMKKELAISFRVTIEELNRYKIGKTIYLDNNDRTTALDWDENTLRGTIIFDMLSTNQAELLEQFEAVEQLRDLWNVKPKRRRAPDDHVLVYAVFKARQQAKTFKQIYELYGTGKLAGYEDSPTNQFEDEELLERYYRLYQP